MKLIAEPATVKVAVRELAVVLSAAAYDTTPFPLPLLPAEIVNQPWLLEAVHWHPEPVVTETVPL